MKWFKHMTGSSTDEKIARLIDVCGLEGYGFFWRIIELIASQVEKNGDLCQVTYTLPTLSRLCYSHHHKVSNLLGKLQVIGLIDLSKIEVMGVVNYVLKSQNVLKYRDEWSSRKVKTPEQLPSNSRATPEQENRTEQKIEQKQKQKKEKTTPAFLSEYSEDFEAFWKVYPRKTDKKKAFEVWNKNIQLGADPKEMTKAAELYDERLIDENTKPQFFKMASSFLNSDWRENLDYVGVVPTHDCYGFPVPSKEQEALDRASMEETFKIIEAKEKAEREQGNSKSD